MLVAGPLHGSFGPGGRVTRWVCEKNLAQRYPTCNSSNEIQNIF
jgi:hypothetical protein